HAEGVWHAGSNQLGGLGPAPKGGGSRPAPSQGSWSYGTVVYTEDGSDTLSASATDSVTTTGSGAHSYSEHSNDSSLGTMRFATGGAGHSVTASGNDSYSFEDHTNDSLGATVSDAYHHYLGNGKYSAGSYSFASVTLHDASSDTVALDVTDRLSFTGSSAD